MNEKPAFLGTGLTILTYQAQLVQDVPEGTYEMGTGTSKREHKGQSYTLDTWKTEVFP